MSGPTVATSRVDTVVGGGGLWRHRRITTLLTVSVAALTLFTVVVLTARDIARQRQTYHEDLRAKADLLTETLNDILANALYFDDVERLRRLTDVLKANPDVRDLAVFDAHGRILVGPGTDKFPAGTIDHETLALALEGGRADFREAEGRMEVVKGISVGAEVLGGVRFAFETAAVDAAVATTIREHLWEGALLMVLAVGLSFLIAQSLVRPVKELTAVTRRIADGDLAGPVERERGDEIGELAEAMGEMSRRLQQTERERAEERTAVLESANERLSRTLTDLRNAQAERDTLIRELEEKNAEMERFTYAASHDLKSPLVTIRGFLGYVEEDVRRGRLDKMEEDLGRVYRATETMGALLEDLLQLSRVGRVVHPSQEVALDELAREAVALVHGRIQERGVEVAVGTGMPVVHGDRARLVEMLQNLVDNAVKFMGDQAHPRIEIGTEVRDRQQICYVRDNGVGIELEHHEQVFGLFVRLRSDSEGSGVGLGLAQRIVDLHGGRIWVESEGTGRGSTFCFTLPGREPGKGEVD